MSVIDKAFAPLAPLPCWGVKRGHGTFLTFEFGEPTLMIREGARVRRALARRLAYPRGQWHLWLYCCAWRVTDGEREVGDWSSSARIDRSARFLNGQKITSVYLKPRGARTTFVFDLGGRLETRPYDRTSEQWFLYEPSGKVLEWRADRRYSYNSSKEESVWMYGG
jgi:hypothetical protein